MDRKKLVFLLVDDNFMMLKMMMPMLSGLGYTNFVIARDGLEAWEKLHGDDHIDIILSDLVMPKLNGLEFLIKIRESEKFWDIPFVMVTGEEHQNQLMSSIEVDVDSYILKPFTPEKLEKEISIVLQKKFEPSPYDKLMEAGRSKLHGGSNNAEAMVFFDKAKEIKPRESDPYYFSAVVSQHEGNFEKAKEQLKECIKLKESYARAYDLLARIYNAEGNYKSERETLETITELSPDMMERNVVLAAACARTGAPALVKEYLKIAAKLARSQSLSMYEKIFRTFLLSEGLEEDAIGFYRRYIDQQFNQPRLINKYALIFQDYKAYDSALYFLERIVNIMRTVKNHDIPTDDMAVYYFNLAVAHVAAAKACSSEEEKTKGYKKADTYVNKALDINPRHRDSMKLYEWLEDHLAK